jgi:hypothetical protein
MLWQPFCLLPFMLFFSTSRFVSVCVFFCASAVSIAQLPSFGWAGAMVGNGYANTGFAICTDQKGFVYTTGIAGGYTIDMDPGPAVKVDSCKAARITFITKTDPAGNLVWGHLLKNGSGPEENCGIAIATDASGNVIVSGYYEGTLDFDPGPSTYDLTAAGSSDIYLLKLNVSGNFIWAETFGGSGDDYATDMATDGFSNIYLTGSFSGVADFDPGPGTHTVSCDNFSDVFLLKCDQAGSLLWARTMGGPGLDSGTGLCLSAAGQVIVGGMFQGTADFDPGPSTKTLTVQDNNFGAFIAGFGQAGTFSWAKGLTGSGTAYLYGLASDPSGNIIVSGGFVGTIDFDPGIQSYNVNPGPNMSVFVAKYDPSFSLQWVRHPETPGGNGSWGYGLCSDGAGNIFAIGNFYGPMVFKKGWGVDSLSSVGNDIFLWKIDPAGKHDWVVGLGGIIDSKGHWPEDYGAAITTDNAGHIYSTGRYSHGADFDPGPATYSLAADDANIFVYKLTYDETVEVKDQQPITALSLQPNPANGSALLVTGESGPAAVIITDLQGRMIRRTHFTGPSITVDTHDLAAGAYLLIIEGGNGVQRMKMLVE